MAKFFHGFRLGCDSDIDLDLSAKHPATESEYKKEPENDDAISVLKMFGDKFDLDFDCNADLDGIPTWAKQPTTESDATMKAAEPEDEQFEKEKYAIGYYSKKLYDGSKTKSQKTSPNTQAT